MARVVPVGDVPPEVVTAVDELKRQGNIPGLSLGVVDTEGQRFAAGFGEADLRQGLPAEPTTQYLWFSMSKIVTATAAMALAESGRLDVDAPVDEYVPYLRAPGRAQPTTRQLLNHTAGLANPLPIRWAHLADAPTPDAEELLRRQIARRRAYRYPVGESARYSNLGYLAAGQVMTVAARQPFSEYIEQNVLEPAGMARTSYAFKAEASAALGYVRAPRIASPVVRMMLPKGIVGARRGRYLELNPFYVDGPAYGGLVGDVLDVGRFLRLHLNDGAVDGRRVISEESARNMRELDQRGKPFDHGIGWFRRPTTGRGDWVEHFGAGAGYWNVMRLYPNRGVGVAIMSNSTRTYDFDPLFALIAESD